MNFVLNIHFTGGIQEVFLPSVKNRAVSVEIEKEIIDGDVSASLSLDAFDDIWTINPNDKVVFPKPLELTDGLRINAKISETGEELAIFVEALNVERTTFKKYYIQPGQPVTLGSGDDNTICYNSKNLVTAHHLTIEPSSAGATLIDKSRNGSFVNERRVNRRQKLKFGDTISIFGLKLIYLGNILAINETRDKCVVNGLQRVQTGSAKQGAQDMPGADEFYSRSPRRMPKLDTAAVEIDPPPEQREAQKQGFLQTIGPALTMLLPMGIGVIFMVVMSQGEQGFTRGPMMFMGLFTAGASAIVAIFWAIIRMRKQKKTEKEQEEKRQNKYSEYLDRIEREIITKHANNRASLLECYPHSLECIKWAAKKDSRLWGRNVNHPDFLTIRLGVGAIPALNAIKCPQRRFSLVDDELAERPFNIKSKFEMLLGVPILVSLREHQSFGIISDLRKTTVETAKIIAMQLAMLHSYTDVKMVFIVPKEEEWGFVKWLPHVWSEDNSIRFVANDTNSVGEVLYFLSEVVRSRTDEDSQRKTNHPHYVLFIADPELVENEALIKRISAHDEENSLGFTALMFYDRLERLPNHCTAIIQRDSDYSGYYSMDNAFEGVDFVDYDDISSINIDEVSRFLTDIKVKEAEGVGVIPQMLTFLDMYKTSGVAGVDIYRNWLQNRTYESMKALIGHRGGGTPIYLDIHEKYHGPHGLVAGTTGSGKSEMLQTYILSLAISYHPHEVAFILIDYKGGGMAESFKNLTHVAGIITNLGGNQTNRALASIRSEIMRRQAVFNEYKLKHIDGYIELYRAGKAGDPMPHLLIIADEFAELKKEQPDFVRELVSASRVGRSLGVHLILATQKPDGVVDEQIWSNTKFRVCLKVAEKADSMGMLKHPDAAYITVPGRGYFQVGNDEIYEEFQSGWSGAKYEPDVPFADEKGSEAKIINIWGKASLLATGRKKTESEEEKKIQLDVVTDYIADIAKKHNIDAVAQVWMPPLPKVLYLEDLPEMKLDEREMAVCVGLLDDPVSQEQRPVAVNFTQNNHMIVVSSMAGGKTTFMQTVLYGLVTAKTPKQLHIYIADFGSRTLGVFGNLPHVGGVVFDDDYDRVDKLMLLLMKELAKRKLLLSSKGIGSYKEYSRLYDDIPSVIFAIDNFAAFMENNPNHDENILLLVREAASYGIYLFISCTNITDIRSRIRQNIRSGVGIQLPEKYDYNEVLGNRGDITAEEGCPGRGLIKVESDDKKAPQSLEFQTALCVKTDNTALISAKLLAEFEKIAKNWSGTAAPQIPQVPEDLSVEAFAGYPETKRALGAGLLPLGYNTKEAQLFTLNPAELFCYIISGDSRTGKTNAIKLFALMSKACGHDVYIVDTAGQIAYWAEENDFTCLTGIDQIHDWFSETLIPEFKRRNKKFKNAGGRKNWKKALQKDKQMVILFHDFGQFLTKAYTDRRDLSDFLETMIKTGNNHKIFLAGVLNREDATAHSMRPAFAAFVSWKDGIHFGGQLDMQRFLHFDVTSAERMKKHPTGYGHMSIGGITTLIVTPEAE